MLRFPKDFVWGSSTSGPQTEGRVAGDGKGDNLWDYWYQVEPNRYYNEIGPEVEEPQTKSFGNFSIALPLCLLIFPIIQKKQGKN